MKQAGNSNPRQNLHLLKNIVVSPDPTANNSQSIMGLKKTFARNFVCQTENPLQMAAILLVVSAPAQLHKLSAADGGGGGGIRLLHIYIYTALLHSHICFGPYGHWSPCCPRNLQKKLRNLVLPGRNSDYRKSMVKIQIYTIASDFFRESQLFFS